MLSKVARHVINSCSNTQRQLRFLSGNWRWLASREWSGHQCKPQVTYLYADCHNSGDYASHLGVRYLARLRGTNICCHAFSNTSKKANTSKALLIGGGGLIQPCFENFWRSVLDSKHKFAIFGVGINQLGTTRGEFSPNLLKRISKSAVSIHVRDNRTKDTFEKAGANDVTVGVCPAVNLIRARYANYKRSARHLLHVIHPSDIRIAGHKVEDFRAHIYGIATQLGIPYVETENLDGLSRRLINKYLNASLVVSSRLHGCIFANALDKPLIAVGTDTKMHSYLGTHHPTVDVHAAANIQDTITLATAEQAIETGTYKIDDSSMDFNKKCMLSTIIKFNE